MKEWIICCLGLLFCLSIAGFITYRTWTLGGSEKDYNIVCIGGHQYYRANYAHKGFLGIRLSSDGKPLKCSGSK